MNKDKNTYFFSEKKYVYIFLVQKFNFLFCTCALQQLFRNKYLFILCIVRKQKISSYETVVDQTSMLSTSSPRHHSLKIRFSIFIHSLNLIQSYHPTFTSIRPSHIGNAVSGPCFAARVFFTSPRGWPPVRQVFQQSQGLATRQAGLLVASLLLPPIRPEPVSGV